MGIIADNMAEVVERTEGTMEGPVTLLQTADTVELVEGPDSRVQVNVDGILVLDIAVVTTVTVPSLRQL